MAITPQEAAKSSSSLVKSLVQAHEEAHGDLADPDTKIFLRCLTSRGGRV